MDEHRFVIRVLAAAQVKQVSSRFSAIVHLLALTVNSLLHWDDNSILSVSDVIDISVGKLGLSLLLNQGLNSWHGRASVSLLLTFSSVTPAFWVNLSLASWKKKQERNNLPSWYLKLMTCLSCSCCQKLLIQNLHLGQLKSDPWLALSNLIFSW